MTEKDYLTIKQFAELTRRNYEAAQRWIERHPALNMHYETIDGKRHLVVSIADLIVQGWTTLEDITRLTVRQSVKMDNTEGNQLLASSIVRKKFTNLSATEIALLDLIPNWRQIKRTKIIEHFEALLKKDRTWFYNDHTSDGRKDKPKALHKLSPDQILAAQQTIISTRSQKSFVEKMIDHELMPDLSSRTWYRIYNQLSQTMVNELDYMKEGKLKMRSRLAPVIRDRTFLRPLQAAVTDFWRIDFIVRWFDGSVVRPSCVVIQDWRTGKILGRAITKFPNSLGVKVAIFDCCLHYGAMEQLNIDNGREFTAYRIIGSKIEQLEKRIKVDYGEVEDKLKQFEVRGFLPALSMQSHRALKKNPTSKPVERTFGRGGFTDWSKDFSNWIGANYWQTPEVVQRAATRFKKGIEKDYVDPKTGEIVHFMDVDELSSAIDLFINKHNNRKSKGFGMDGKSPNELWDELIVETPPRKINIEKLAFHFLEGPEKPRKIRVNGYIELKKDLFFSSDVTLRNKGREVFLRWNPVDGFWWSRGDKKEFALVPNDIFVYDIEGNYLTTVQFVNRTHPTEGGKDVSLMMTKKMGPITAAERNVKRLIAGTAPIVNVKDAPTEITEAYEKKKLEERENEDPLEGNQFNKIVI